MSMHPDFQKIHKRFVSQYGKKKGDDFYYAWLNKHKYDDTKAFPKKSEKKELLCRVHGMEMKEDEKTFYVEGLIATTHVDNLDREEGIDIPDMCLKETLESWANQINTLPESRVMGVHHSEGRNFNPEYFGEADIVNSPAKVIELNDGEWGLLVKTGLLKHDPRTPEIIEQFQSGELNSFSITYDTNGFDTADFDWVDGKLVRILNPETKLFGYTAASDPVNPNAVATGYGFKEFKELVGKKENKTEVVQMPENEVKEAVPAVEQKPIEKAEQKEAVPAKPVVSEADAAEMKSFMEEFRTFKKQKEAHAEEKELLERAASKIEGVVRTMDNEVKEKVLVDSSQKTQGEVPLEVKELREAVQKKYELKEQFRRAGAVCDKLNLDFREVKTTVYEGREFKNFTTNGRNLEFKALGITTNQNADTDYLQSSAELQDVYDPVIYNALNQATVTWNLLAKDSFAGKGNNQVQFVLKTAANTSAAFYANNAVASANVTRLKYQTKFKKIQVGVSVDGDMIAAARGGPVGDVFAQEVMDSTLDMLAVLNAALFAEKGAESDAECLGFEYVSDSAGNTTLYNVTRSAANKLAPTSAADTYINQSSTIVSMTNLRAAIRQAVKEGANKANLVFITNHVQGDMIRGKFDDSRRMLTSKDTSFGFSTDLFVDGVPVFEDKDCNTDDWWLVDLETHRVGIWMPPSLERLGKTADSEDAFIKMYLAVYNRAPRRLVQIYGCATS